MSDLLWKLTSNTLESDLPRDKLQIILYIKENYKEALNQKEIAERFFYSREHLSRLFKKYVGMNYKEYLAQYRLQQSMEELLGTDKEIVQIALNHGFSDAKQYINTFRKYFADTPYQFRKKYGRKIV